MALTLSIARGAKVKWINVLPKTAGRIVFEGPQAVEQTLPTKKIRGLF